MVTWVVFLAVGLVVGIGVGIYVSRLDDEAKRTRQSLERQLQQANEEMQRYKEQVKGHFVTTARLVNNMTESYRAIHEHLTDGATVLCNNEMLAPRVAFSGTTLLTRPAPSMASPAPSMVSEEKPFSPVSVGLITAQMVSAAESADASALANGESHAEMSPSPQDAISNSVAELTENKTTDLDQSRVNASRMVH